MNSEQRFYQDDYKFEEKEEKLSQNLTDFMLFFKNLSVEERVQAKRLIREINIF